MNSPIVLPSPRQWQPNGHGGRIAHLRHLHLPVSLRPQASVWLKGLQAIYGNWNGSLRFHDVRSRNWAIFSGQAHLDAPPTAPVRLAPESYVLESKPSQLTVGAADARGVLYGLASAFQMLATGGGILRQWGAESSKTATANMNPIRRCPPFFPKSPTGSKSFFPN